MKIIRIEHWRCGEPDVTAYMVAPDDYTEERIDQDFDDAEDEYLRDKKALNESTPKPIKFYFQGTDWPGAMTVSEIHQAIANRNEEIKAWEADRAQRERSFASYLRDKGYKNFWQLKDEEVTLKTIEWGHKHGETIVYE